MNLRVAVGLAWSHHAARSHHIVIFGAVQERKLAREVDSEFKKCKGELDETEMQLSHLLGLGLQDLGEEHLAALLSRQQTGLERVQRTLVLREQHAHLKEHAAAMTDSECLEQTVGGSMLEPSNAP